MAPSAAVIGVPGQDARCPVELLRQHDTHQKMRPGLQSQRNAVWGAVAQGTEALGAADQEGHSPDIALPQLAQMLREGFAGEGFSGGVEGDAVGAGGDRRLQRLQLIGRAFAAAGNLMELDGRETEPGRKRSETPCVILVEPPLRRRFFQPPGRNEVNVQRLGSNRYGLAFAGHICGPELLELVELANLRAKDVNDRVARIDQHPIAMGHALDPDIPLAGCFQPFHEMLGDSADMALRATARNDHVIGDRRLPVKVDRHNVFGFVVFEGVENELDEIRATKKATIMTGQSPFSRGWTAP